MVNLSLCVYLITKRDKLSFKAFKPRQTKQLPQMRTVHLPNGQMWPHKKMLSFSKPRSKGHCKAHFRPHLDKNIREDQNPAWVKRTGKNCFGKCRQLP